MNEWIEAVEGRLVAGQSDVAIEGVSTDSRTIEQGRLFVALSGPNFDGHDFCSDAVAKGARALMVSRSEPALSAIEGAESAIAVVAVDDTLAALGKLAKAYRARFEPIVAALSGSSGKTTTKAMLAAMVESAGGFASPGNFNNRIGVPLSVFGLESSHSTAVFELAMNRPGELAALAEIVVPEIVALTNVGSAHLGNFESRDALRAAKAELIVHAPEDVVVVLNADCYDCRRIAEEHCGERDVAWFGLEEAAHFRAEEITPDPPLGYRFKLVHPEGSQAVTLRAFGRHNISNALCATAVAYLLEVPLEQIYAGLEAFRAAPMRSEILEVGRVTIVADCYNANPESVEAALDALAEFAGSRHKIFVFADMLELGDEAEMAHREVGQTAADHGIDLLATTGELAQWASWEAGRMLVRAGHFDTKDELVKAVVDEVGRNDVILVKGSRLMELEEVVERLKELL